MITIEIDQETYSFLQEKAIAFVETKPGDTVKRLLGINVASTKPSVLNSTVIKSPDRSEKLLSEDENSNQPNYIKVNKKQPKTNIPALIRAGLLKDGQSLIFQDYRGNQYPQYKVILSGNSLTWENQSYSMSDLAKTLLNKHGYNNEFVRGPIFWVNEAGKSVAKLWEMYLSSQH